jgi:hypothetical protein
MAICVSTLIDEQVQTHTGCYKIPTSMKKEPRRPIREASEVHWDWNRTRVLSPWEQDQNDGDDNDEDDGDDNEIKVQVLHNLTCFFDHLWSS